MNRIYVAKLCDLWMRWCDLNASSLLKWFTSSHRLRALSALVSCLVWSVSVEGLFAPPPRPRDTAHEVPPCHRRNTVWPVHCKRWMGYPGRRSMRAGFWVDCHLVVAWIKVRSWLIRAYLGCTSPGAPSHSTHCTDGRTRPRTAPASWQTFCHIRTGSGDTCDDCCHMRFRHLSQCPRCSQWSRGSTDCHAPLLRISNIPSCKLEQNSKIKKVHLVSTARRVKVVDRLAIRNVFNAKVIHEAIAAIAADAGHVKCATAVVFQLNFKLFQLALVVGRGELKWCVFVHDITWVALTTKRLGIEETGKTGDN